MRKIRIIRVRARMMLFGVGGLFLLGMVVLWFCSRHSSTVVAAPPEAFPGTILPAVPHGDRIGPPAAAGRDPDIATFPAADPGTAPAGSASPIPGSAARPARAAEARWLREDWNALLGSLQRDIPESRHAAMDEWRQRHGPAIAAIEEELGGILVFPESLADLPGTGPLPVPAPVAAARRESPGARAFLDERDDLARERRAVTGRADLPDPERLQLLAEWELANEERLRNHRLLAISLGFLNVELLESELQARRQAPNPQP